MCRPCFAGDTKIILFPRDLHTRRVGSPVIMWIHTLEQGGPGHAPLENFDKMVQSGCVKMLLST